MSKEYSDISGTATIKISKSNRINVPKFSNLKVGDEVVPRYSLDYDSIVFMPLAEFEAKTNKLLADIRADVLANNISSEKERALIRYYGGTLSLPAVKVDAHGALLLYPEIIEKLNLDGKAFVIARNNTLELYRDEETYNKRKAK